MKLFEVSLMKNQLRLTFIKNLKLNFFLIIYVFVVISFSLLRTYNVCKSKTVCFRVICTLLEKKNKKALVSQNRVWTIERRFNFQKNACFSAFVGKYFGPVLSYLTFNFQLAPTFNFCV